MKRVTERQKGMPRLNAVVNHEVYQTYYKRICECETDRVFCCHQMNHLLDVARIAYIKNLEEGLGFDKELIYVAAVLHDIGKSFQYRQQIPHEIAGERIARRILDSLPAAVPAVVGTAMIGTHGFLVGAVPSRLLTSSNSGLAMMIPIALDVSIEDPPPIAII